MGYNGYIITSGAEVVLPRNFLSYLKSFNPQGSILLPPPLQKTLSDRASRRSEYVRGDVDSKTASSHKSSKRKHDREHWRDSAKSGSGNPIMLQLTPLSVTQAASNDAHSSDVYVPLKLVLILVPVCSPCAMHRLRYYCNVDRCSELDAFELGSATLVPGSEL
jgi:hypothetical protein